MAANDNTPPNLEDALEHERQMHTDGAAKFMAKVEKSDKAKGKEKAKSPADEEPKKKRAANAYLVWANANRAEVKAKMQAELEEGEKLKPTDVTKQLAANWKALDDAEKAEWKAKAEAEQSGEDSD